MDDILEDLYNGIIYPAEDCVPCSEEYKRAIREHSHCEALLRGILDEEHQPVMNLLLEAHHTVVDQTGLAFFREGLRLGARLALALLQDDSVENEV